MHSDQFFHLILRCAWATEKAENLEKVQKSVIFSCMFHGF